MITIKELVKVSGDSVLEKYHYKNGIMSLTLYMSELDKRFLIELKTSILFISIPTTFVEVYRTCYLELLELSTLLKTENGIFVPSSGFVEVMKEKRVNVNLAYGLKMTKNKYIFSLCSSVKMASFIISDLEDITILELAHLIDG